MSEPCNTNSEDNDNDIFDTHRIFVECVSQEMKTELEDPFAGYPGQNKVWLVLWRKRQYYGGPEEGGWYGWDHYWVHAARFVNETEARAAMQRIVPSMRIWNRRLDRDRIEGLSSAYEAAVLADPSADLDGPDDNRMGTLEEYYMTIQDGKPENEYGPRHYE